MGNQRRWRLATMMGLVYAIQGSFWPILGPHLADLGIEGRARGWIFATLAISSAIAPLWAGHVVDRAMAAERFLALVAAGGTALLVVLATGLVQHANGIFLTLLAFWMLIGPAYGVCNAVALRNLADPPREFGWVRMWGTVGWMVAGWVVSLVMACSGSTRAGSGAWEAFWVAAAFALAAAIYCLTLPHTPPLAGRLRGQSALGESFEVVRQRDTAVFLLTSFGVYLTVPLVFQVMPGYLEDRGLPRAWISTTMTLGQLSEVAMLAVLPWAIGRLGAKGTMALGIAAWFVRFLSLTFVPPLWLAVSGTVLHGIGIAGFTVGGQVYLDSRCDGRLRATGQGLLLVCTSGLGALLGNVLAGEIVSRALRGDVLVFLIPCVIDGALLLYFLRGFRARVSSVSGACRASAHFPSPALTLRGSVAGVGHLVTESADG